MASISAVVPLSASPGWSLLLIARSCEYFHCTCPTLAHLSLPPYPGCPSLALPSLWLANPTLTAALAVTLSSWVSMTDHPVLSLCRFCPSHR